jgi:hypothetical protein
MLLAVGVANFLDFIERSKGERLVFVDWRSKVLAVVAIFHFLQDKNALSGRNDKEVDDDANLKLSNTRNVGEARLNVWDCWNLHG